MYYVDRAPPHFHASYADNEIAVDIGSGAFTGEIAPRAAALILDWLKLHRAELRDHWLRAQRREPLNRIKPLD